jgi:hypothetical protein
MHLSGMSCQYSLGSALQVVSDRLSSPEQQLLVWPGEDIYCFLKPFLFILPYDHGCPHS